MHCHYMVVREQYLGTTRSRIAYVISRIVRFCDRS